MLPTVLHLLRMLRGVVPFLVITATLSEEMVRALAKQLDAEPIVLSAEEAAAIPSQHKTRRMHVAEQELTAAAVLEKHQRRSITICNTVARAQVLFEDLRQQTDDDTDIHLLHSRFLPDDRETSEDWLQREIGVMRAIGVTSPTVVGIFIAEGVLVGVLSWLLSVPLSAPGAYALSSVVGEAIVQIPLDFAYSVSGALLWLLIVMMLSAARRRSALLLWNFAWCSAWTVGHAPRYSGRC
jgi:hypothetical protein